MILKLNVLKAFLYANTDVFIFWSGFTNFSREAISPKSEETFDFGESQAWQLRVTSKMAPTSGFTRKSPYE